MLADVLNRDGQQLSATQTRNQALADADHLALLHAIWTAETAHAREQRYQDLLLNALPPGYHAEPSHQAKWLWRPCARPSSPARMPQVLSDAIGERDLAGARDIHAVIDARLRRRSASVVPLLALPWSARSPEHRPGATCLRRADRRDDGRPQAPERRTRRHHPPAWAVTALGACPTPRRPAGLAEACLPSEPTRELSGYNHPADPIGPEPSRQPGPARRLARGPRRPRPRRRPGRARHARRAAAAPARHLPPRNRLGTALGGRRTPPLPRQPGTPAWPAPRRRRSRLRAAQGRQQRAAREHDLAASYKALHEAYRQAKPCSPPSWPTEKTGTTPPVISGS